MFPNNPAAEAAVRLLNLAVSHIKDKHPTDIDWQIQQALSKPSQISTTQALTSLSKLFWDSTHDSESLFQHNSRCSMPLTNWVEISTSLWLWSRTLKTPDSRLPAFPMPSMLH